MGTRHARSYKREQTHRAAATARHSVIEQAYYEAMSKHSVVSVPHRNPNWGDSRYPGNCDGTLVKDLVLRYRASSIADPMEGSGTTRDVVAWLNNELNLGVTYWGGDIQRGFNLLRQAPPGRYDLVWVHPPYWDIVRYTDHQADLSTSEDYTLYLTRLRKCLRRCYNAVADGGRLAVLVGDVRKRGRYYPIARDVMNLAGELGELVSVVIKTQYNVRSNTKRYGTLVHPRIMHETCVIFYRPTQ